MPAIATPSQKPSIPPSQTSQIAYVRKLSEYDDEFYGIYDENGRPLAVAATRELAFITIRQHDLQPVDVH